jgi:hypothetical protein
MVGGEALEGIRQHGEKRDVKKIGRGCRGGILVMWWLTEAPGVGD